MRRVALYARVSTTDQNPALQLDALRAYAATRNLTVVAEHVDHGVSGAKDRRPELDKLMTAVRRGQVDVVLVWKFSRFARSVRHLVTALEEFNARSVDFVTVTEGIDTSTPAGKLQMHIIAAMDEFFLDVLKENTKAGMSAAKRRGRRIGRPQRVVDVNEVRARLAAGASQRVVARDMGLPLATMQAALARAA